MSASFLRSNDQRVVQLDYALASLGWYLERRDGELNNATPEEKAAIEARIGRQLDGRVIRLKEGAQAYTATFYGQPEVAKKNPAKIFLSISDGGNYERIFSADLTAEKMIIAHEIKTFVDDFVRRFSSIRRKLQASDNIVAAYEPLLGKEVAEGYKDVLHQVLPQCSLFLCGTIYQDLVVFQKKDPTEIPALLQTNGSSLVQEHLLHILNYARNNTSKADKSWPTLLKSNTFFGYITAYLGGVRTSSSPTVSAATSKGSI